MNPLKRRNVEKLLILRMTLDDNTPNLRTGYSCVPSNTNWSRFDEPISHLGTVYSPREDRRLRKSYSYERKMTTMKDSTILKQVLS